MMRNSFPEQFQLSLLQLLTVSSPGFLSVQCWEELGSGFSVDLALEGNKAFSTALCLFLQANQSQLLQPLLTQVSLTTSGAFTELELGTIHLSNPCFPPLRALWFHWFFTYPAIHPSHPHFLLSAAAAVSSRFHSLSVFLWLFCNICQKSKVPKTQEICRASLQAPCSQVQTNHFRALTVPLRK